MSSSIVSLFSEQKIAQAGSPSMVASVFAHFGAIGLLFVLMKVAVPHVVHVAPQEFSVVRILNYNPSRSEASSGDSGLHYSPHRTQAMKSPGGVPRPRRRVLPPNHKFKSGPETILQAHANHVPPPLHSVIPTVLLTAAHPKITRSVFTPPPHPNPAAPTPQLLTLPNAEVHVADMMVSATAISNPIVVLPATTTVPYKLDNPTTDAQIVETSSPTKEAPTPTRLLAISDLKLVKGSIVIPQTENQVQKTPTKGSLTAGQLYKTVGIGIGSRPGRSVLPAPTPGKGTNGSLVAAAKANSLKPMKVARNAAKPGENSPAGTVGMAAAVNPQPNATLAESGAGNEVTFTHLSKPKTGRFGAVLMGDSSEQEYPETADLWSGRNAYTVYINVGTRTNWILQYSLPKSATPAQLQEPLGAPYPYELLRPNFASSDLNAEALLVHGFIDKDGRLIHATVEFPPGFSLAKLVLQALAQWQFRPATLNGVPTQVEVLLIIPNQSN